MSEHLKVLVVGCGHMGASHARAYHGIDGFEVAIAPSRFTYYEIPTIESVGGGSARCMLAELFEPKL